MELDPEQGLASDHRSDGDARMVGDGAPMLGIAHRVDDRAVSAGRLAEAPAMLARLTYSWAAYELSERLVSEAGTYGDEYGRGDPPVRLRSTPNGFTG